MIAITDTIIDISRIYPQIFQDIFVVFEQIEATTLTLLDNFIEDADNYAQQFELHGDDDDDIGAFTDKITAVY
ncbi:unnamed protein product, partial [Rotaria sp. Silwood2]